jgi:SAM-dependent methyltransferase
MRAGLTDGCQFTRLATGIIDRSEACSIPFKHNGLVTVLAPDYDADPERFLSNTKWPHDDVHPYVAERFNQSGAKRVLDVGGGHGSLARLLPDLGIEVVLLDMSPTMLAHAPPPAVRADGARLPIADSRFDAVAALYTLYHYEDPLIPIAECRRVLRSGGLFVACSANRDSTPELAEVIPRWGLPGTFDGEDSPSIVRSVFNAPGDVLEVVRWDAPMHTLIDTDYASAFLRTMGMSERSAAAAAAGLDLPLTLTMRGCFVYATKS